MEETGERPDWHAKVRALYVSADAAVAAAGPRCDASGRCCRFKEYGHTLFISALEAEVLLADAPPMAGPVTADRCPFQVEDLCTAREPRPLGCRVYFCDPSYAGKGEAISETHLRMLKDLSDSLGMPWRYAPLHYFLREHAVKELNPSPAPIPNGRTGLNVVPAH